MIGRRLDWRARPHITARCQARADAGYRLEGIAVMYGRSLEMIRKPIYKLHERH